MATNTTTAPPVKDSASQADESAKDMVIRVRIAGDLLQRMEEVMADTGITTKSSFVRKAIINEIERDKRQAQLDALEYEAKLQRIRTGNTDPP